MTIKHHALWTLDYEPMISHKISLSQQFLVLPSIAVYLYTGVESAKAP